MQSISVLHSCGTWLEVTENWLYTSVRSLPAEIRSSVVCSQRANDSLYGDIPISCLPGSRWSKYSAALGYFASTRTYRGPVGFTVEAARRRRAEILHSHFGPMGWRNVRAARQLGIKHVVTFYGADANPVAAKTSRWLSRYEELFQNVSLVTCEGPALAGRLRQLGCPEPKIAVNHLGVDLERFAFRPRRWIPGTQLRVLIAGRFTEKKGIPLALNALRTIQKRFPLHVTIIGDAGASKEQQAEKTKILQAAAATGLEGCCQFLGMQPHSVFLEAAYDHHVFLSPSITAESGDTEGGLPVSLIELAATGMPIVSTWHGDIPELIKDRESGCLSRERDLPGLIESLEWLLESPVRWNDLASCARRVAENEFNAITQGIKLGELYAGILDRR